MTIHEDVIQNLKQGVKSLYIREDGHTIYKCACPYLSNECPAYKMHKCDGHDFDIINYKWLFRKRMGDCLCCIREPDQHDKSHHKSSGTYIEEFVWNVLDEAGVEYIKNDRRMLKRKELDIFVPSVGAAIECNGMFWHSTVFKTDKSHHNKKWKACNNKQVKLLSIWEDTILLRPEAVRGAILRAVKCFDEVVSADKCIVKKFSKNSPEVAAMMDKYNMLGPVKANLYYGLTYKKELVAVAAFSKSSKHKKGGWKIHNLCFKPGLQITGATSKMVTSFCEDMQPTSLEAEASNDEPYMYDALEEAGFMRASKQKTFKSWFIDPISYVRYLPKQINKEELVRLLRPFGYKDSWKMSATDIMVKILGFHHINDTGYTNMVYTGLL